MSVLNSSHDAHMLAVDNKEDGIVRRITEDSTGLLQGIQDNEHKRNRQKVTEIEHYVDCQRDELDSLEMATPQP